MQNNQTNPIFLMILGKTIEMDALSTLKFDVIYGCPLKSDNLQYNMLGWWDDRLIEQVSDVLSILCKNPFN